MKVLDQLSIVKVGITINAISASKHKYLRCIMKQTIYRLTPNGVISRLQPYVRTQLAIATNVIQLGTVLINSTYRPQQPYVLTQQETVHIYIHTNYRWAAEKRARVSNIKKPDNTLAARQLDKETRRIRDN